MAKRQKRKGEKQQSDAGVGVLTEAQTAPSLKAPTGDQVKKIARKLDAWDEDRKVISDAARETIAKAKETQHLDPMALAIGRRLNKLTDEKLSVTLPHLLKYIDDLGLEKRATAQADMFVQDELAGQTDLEAAIGDNTGAAPSARLRIIDETGERDIA